MLANEEAKSGESEVSDTNEDKEKDEAKSEESDSEQDEDDDKKPAAKRFKKNPMGGEPFDIEQMAINSYQRQKLRSASRSNVDNAVNEVKEVRRDEEEYDDDDTHTPTSTSSATDGETTESE